MKLPTMSLFACFPIPPLPLFCLGGGCSTNGIMQDPEQWASTVRCVLMTTPWKALGISQHIRQGLLLEDEDDNAENDAIAHVTLDDPSEESTNSDLECVENHDDYDEAIILKGLPRHPLYKVLSLRLCLLCVRELNKSTKKHALVDTEEGNTHNESIAPFWLIPATEFGLQEETPLPTIPTITKLNVKAIRQWFSQAGNCGVLTLLGLRHTVGSDPRSLLPPSWTNLLQAANQPYKANSKLSVAARARAKHAHRSETAVYFGIAKGPPEAQNMAAEAILRCMLREAVWINIHTFAGTDGKPSLEVRVQAGYGARWVADWTNPLHPTDIEFRGFLEPQMAEGHLKGWKH